MRHLEQHEIDAINARISELEAEAEEWKREQEAQIRELEAAVSSANNAAQSWMEKAIAAERERDRYRAVLGSIAYADDCSANGKWRTCTESCKRKACEVLSKST